ncbi:MAG: methyltransferase domain-containing protein [Acidobacteria bacterium]|nr:methyltransferase domain-containing protein [Acidobacteriota bacterium]
MGWRTRTRLEPPAMDIDEAYVRWAPFYPPRSHNRLMEVEEHALRELLPQLSGRSVLDAGCGTGRYARLARQSGAASVIGVDRSRAMLRQASASDGRFVLADLRSLPFADGSIDIVLCGLALMDVEELDRAIGEMARVLSPGGTLVYSTLHPSGADEGWTRTFETPLGRHVIPSSWHSMRQHWDACEAAGLHVSHHREPAIDGRSPARPVALVVRADRVG